MIWSRDPRVRPATKHRVSPIRIFLVLHSVPVIGNDQRVPSDADDNNLKMVRFHRPNSDEFSVLLMKKDAVYTKNQ